MTGAPGHDPPDIGEQAEAYLQGHDIGAEMVREGVELIASWTARIVKLAETGADTRPIMRELGLMLRNAGDTLLEGLDDRG